MNFILHVTSVVVLVFFFSFRKHGDEWSVDQEVTNELEAFTCPIYGHARKKSVNTVRSAKDDGRGERGTDNQIKSGSPPTPPLQRQPFSTHRQGEIPPC